MNRARRAAIEANEVSKVVTCSLGGYGQKVMIEGRYRSNPVVVVLHGGPGIPLPYAVGGRGLFPEFTEHFIMVCWDQLGCGINNHVLDESFTIRMFVDMTVDLVRTLKDEFPDNQIILFGASWGSVLAVQTALRIPELIDGVVSYGQAVKNLFFNEEIYQALEQSQLPAKAKAEIRRWRQQTTHSAKELMKAAKWLRKYTEGYQCEAGGSSPLMPLLLGMLTSPDYRIRDCVAMVVNGYANNKSLWKELLDIDLTESLENVTMPYRILQGSTDIVTPTREVERMMAGTGNTNLSMSVIANNGHMPGPDGMDRIVAEIRTMTK